LADDWFAENGLEHLHRRHHQENNLMHCRRTLLLVLTGMVFMMASTARAGYWTDPYDVVWTTPSKDSAGSMPLGNGEVGINLWVEENRDLNFYISRSDSFSEIGRLLKVGQVKVAITPNPFVTGAKFEQRLHLHDGVCEITAGEGEKKVTLKIFVDPDVPVVNVIGESASPITVKATAISWRTEKRTIPRAEQKSAWTMRDAPFDLVESADIFERGPEDAVAWYHHDGTSIVPSTIETQSLQSIRERITDPIQGRIFGGYLIGNGFDAQPDHSIQTGYPITRFKIRVASVCQIPDSASKQSPEAEKAATDRWLKASADAVFKPFTRWKLSHPGPFTATPGEWAFDSQPELWWHDFWDRSWVVTDAGHGIEIPANKYDLRIGVDSNGQNKFPGELARTETHAGAFTAEQIGELAAIPHDRRPGPVRGIEVATAFTESFTVAAWIKPNQLAPGRIFDKLSAGQSDGFLFDTYPGNTLRLIVGNNTLSAPAGILTAGKWHHVAATVDSTSGLLCIYLDGKVVVQNSPDGVSPIARAYTLQRYVQACGGRGNYPIKFNGGIFTVEPKHMGEPFNADYRAWGECYWWQNTRHMYHPMLASGDIDMLDPLFNMYEACRPICEARAMLYHRAKVSYFPETMTSWGTYSNGDYGWNRQGHVPADVLCPYWQYAWNQGPELVGLLLDRWDYTNDPAF